MSNFSLRYSQMLGWLPLPGWWPTAKDNRQTAQPIVTQAEIQSRHLAFHRAFQRFVQEQPLWVSRRFDDAFLRQVTDAPELPSGLALAAAWDRQFGPISPMPIRCQQMAELAVVAEGFLRCYQQEVLISV